MIFGEMIALVLLVVVTSALCSKEVCPGGSFVCPDTATCCQLSDKSYGCCPMENAVCCDDHIHCCPPNTKCDAGICIQLDNFNTSATINCFDSDFECPDSSTCCEGSLPGTYICCPMENAVCCAGGNYCCPEGTTCNLKEGTCAQNRERKIGYAKYSKLTESKKIANVICPGSTFQCPNGYTCCQLPGGDWGCCPFVKATCCSDHLHCCPENMKCNPTSQACSQGLTLVPSVPKVLAKPINVGLVCPDNTTCAETMTCCRMNNMHFGCCTYPNATCCADREHCCPEGFLCDDEEKMCAPKS